MSLRVSEANDETIYHQTNHESLQWNLKEVQNYRLPRIALQFSQ
ncbi:hypothetical protein [Helicobacter rodentium]|nr:hypothetical protein [Helicobacter rodentium]